ncbi:MAG: Hpt domain-containing protein [Chitinophagaceae bacterium]|nr:Hpt domain-containing protein [Oligoflexus sp.]
MQIFSESLAASLLDSNTLGVLKEFELVDEETSFLDEVIEAFGVETPALIEALNCALRAKDVSGILFYAHQLKGLCSNVGVKRLALLCGSIEEYFALIPSDNTSEIEFFVRDTYENSMKELQSNWKRGS